MDMSELLRRLALARWPVTEYFSVQLLRGLAGVIEHRPLWKSSGVDDDQLLIPQVPGRHRVEHFDKRLKAVVLKEAAAGNNFGRMANGVMKSLSRLHISSSVSTQHANGWVDDTLLSMFFGLRRGALALDRRAVSLCCDPTRFGGFDVLFGHEHSSKADRCCWAPQQAGANKQNKAC